MTTSDTNGAITGAGFISFPAGTYSADSSAPTKSLASGFAYDRAYGKWLPVDWRWVSDDGSRYVYATYPSDQSGVTINGVIHSVSVSTGADRVIKNGSYVITDYTGGSVYLTAWVGGHDGPGPQVGWAMNPLTGAMRNLPGGQKYGYWIGSGAGWRTDYNSADPTPVMAPMVINRLTRVDLSTGGEATWFYQPGTQWVQIVGFDQAGHPIIEAGLTNSVTVYLLSDPTHKTKLFSSVATYQAVADSHGIWFSDGKAIYLYDRSGFRKVSPTGGAIAGGCH